jgi:hypothetical protein
VCTQTFQSVCKPCVTCRRKHVHTQTFHTVLIPQDTALELCRFLYLRLHGGTAASVGLSPSYKMDVLWHQVLLNTRMCNEKHFRLAPCIIVIFQQLHERQETACFAIWSLTYAHEANLTEGKWHHEIRDLNCLTLLVYHYVGLPLLAFLLCRPEPYIRSKLSSQWVQIKAASTLKIAKPRISIHCTPVNKSCPITQVPSPGQQVTNKYDSCEVAFKSVCSVTIQA